MEDITWWRKIWILSSCGENNILQMISSLVRIWEICQWLFSSKTHIYIIIVDITQKQWFWPKYLYKKRSSTLLYTTVHSYLALTTNIVSTVCITFFVCKQVV